MSLNNVLSDLSLFCLLWQSSLQHSVSLRCVLIAVAAIAPLLNAPKVAAQVAEDQITADQTLGNESTRVEFDNGTYEITGGSIRGADAELLFHSFNRFSIKSGQTAQFVVEDTIGTIFGQVIGGDRSQIDGTISADAVDLFFLNPAGVVFGPDSSIEIGGSILVSTAESLTFADGSEFSSANPQPAPLLTVSQPIGLSFGETSRDIKIGIEGDFSPLNTDRALFAGNGITLTGGIIIPSGQVELASLASGSSVELAPSDESLVSRFDIDSGNFLEFDLSDIDLMNAVIDTSFGESSGRIVLVGRQVQLQEGSEVFSQNVGSLPGEGISILASADLSVEGASISTGTFGIGDGGDLLLEANGSIALLGGSALRTESGRNATGTAGMLTIRAQQLTVRGGSVVSTSTFGNGLGGDLVVEVPGGTVEVSDVVEASEVGFDTPNDIVPSLLISNTLGGQDSGQIQIDTGNLIVRSGGQIESGPRAEASGNSGGISINATESVVVTGESNGNPSKITSSNSITSSGNSGPISLTTGRLLISDGGQVFSSTNGTGQGGDLTIQAEEVVLSGAGTDEGKLFGLFARTENSGDSGRLNLTTDSLVIRDGARLTVSTDEDAIVEDLGTVRDADVTAERIVLDNGTITAESLSGNGGILNFDVQDFLLLRNNSLISATAGTAAAGGDGGNVNISAPTGFIIAAPDENSDIIANAFLGSGGNINITTQSILGLEARQAIASNTTNDIDASSEFGTAGTIVFNNLELDPTEGIIELPAKTVAPGQVAQRCLADSEGRNTFVITGQGGIPPSPGDIVRNETLRPSPAANIESNSSSEVSSLPEVPVVEAAGWQRDQKGRVVLVAADAVAAQANSTHYHSCTDGQRIVQQPR